MTASRARWRLIGSVVVLGGVAAFGQAPYDQPVVMLIALLAAFALWPQARSVKQAALFGWAFGFGYFAHTLQWIVSPFMVDVARHGWMAPFALAFLAAGLALFWGAAFGIARMCDLTRSWPLILCLPAAELIRGYVFTGFPWGMFSQALIDGAGGQALAFIGPFALNLCIIALVVAIVSLPKTPFGWAGRSMAVVFGLAALLAPPLVPDAAQTDHVVRLVQPNASQRDKWDPDKIPIYFNRQLEYTAAPPTKGLNAPTLVMWSETAIPWLLEGATVALDQIALAGGTAEVALGLQRSDGLMYYNSMVVLGADGTPRDTYDKHHLVPFGEYMPFAALMARLNIFGLAERLRGGYGAGGGAQLVDFGPMGRALPLICYEAVFPHDVNAAPQRPDFLIQITNDAWFGKGAGPRQHLAQARMRAIEQGLPLARAGNTGISAMIDPYGRIQASLPLNSAGYIDATLPKPLRRTIYSQTGDIPFALLLLVGLAFCANRARRGKTLTGT